jgi:hypothetical protein
MSDRQRSNERKPKRGKTSAIWNYAVEVDGQYVILQINN